MPRVRAQKHPFAEAAFLMQDALQVQGGWKSDDVEWTEVR
jgi:hypothetical protein